MESLDVDIINEKKDETHQKVSNRFVVGYISLVLVFVWGGGKFLKLVEIEGDGVYVIAGVIVLLALCGPLIFAWHFRRPKIGKLRFSKEAIEVITNGKREKYRIRDVEDLIIHYSHSNNVKTDRVSFNVNHISRSYSFDSLFVSEQKQMESMMDAWQEQGVEFVLVKD